MFGGEVNPSDPQEGKKHWAFQPLSDADVRGSNLGSGVGSPIDWFVEERLKTMGVRQAAGADSRTLLR